jgi:hypothetical protein
MYGFFALNDERGMGNESGGLYTNFLRCYCCEMRLDAKMIGVHKRT